MAIVDEDFRPEAILEEDSDSSSDSSSSSNCDTNSSTDDSKTIQNCTSPETVFAIATSFSYFLAQNFNQIELETLINIMGLITSNLSAIITQIEICEGESVVSLPE